MFNWLKKKPSDDSDIVVAQPPGQIFPWPKGAVLTAVDEVIFAIPVALFEKDRPMGEALFGPKDMELNMPPGSDKFFVRLRPGMSLSLAKSVQSYVVTEDKNPRRIKVRKPSAA